MREHNWTRGERAVIKLALREAYQLSFGDKYYMQLEYCGTFGDDFLLQISWERDYLRYSKTTYEDKGYLDSNIKVELGSSSIGTAFNKLRHSLKKIKTPAFVFDNDFYDGRDGADISFTFGQEHHAVKFDWWTVAVPDEWIPLNQFVNQLLAFEKELAYQKTEIIAFDGYYELEEHERRILLEFKS